VLDLVDSSGEDFRGSVEGIQFADVDGEAID